MSHAAPATSAPAHRRFRTLTRAYDALVAHPRGSVWAAVGLLLLVGVIVRLPQLGHRIAGSHSFWESQAAFTAREYASTGIDLFRTPLPVFGSDANVPFNVPLVPALASLLVSAGVDAATAMRVIGLLGFTATGALIALLLLRWHDGRAAVLAVALFEFLPFGVHWGAGAFVDFVGVALALTMVAGLDGGLRGSRIWLVGGIAAGVVGFLVSPTVAPLYLLLVAASAWTLARERGWKAIRRPVAIGAIGLVVGLGLWIAWTVTADAIKDSHESTRFLTSAGLVEWTFGSLQQRSEPSNFATVAGRVADEIAGPAMVGLLVALVVLILMRDSRRRILLAGLLAVVVAGPLVFFNQYVADSSALSAIYPAAVAAMAVAGVFLLSALPLTLGRRLALTLTAVALLLGSTGLSPQGGADLRQFRHEDAVPEASELLIQNTMETDGIVMIGCDWDPTILFNAHRTGIMFRGAGAGHFWDDADIRQYPYLLSCDPALDPNVYLPVGYRTEQLEDDLFRVIPNDR